jgi:hypothetical protein
MGEPKIFGTNVLFRCTTKVRIFSLSFHRINLWIMHEVVNVGKKITKAVFRSIEKCTMQKKIPRHIKLAIHAWSAKCG